MATQKLKDRVYVETEFQGANVSCIKTSRGLVLIDTPYIPNDIRRWQQELASIGGDVCYIILTDHHFDHVLGSTFFHGEIIAHELARETMLHPGGTLRESFVPLMGVTAQLAQEIASLPLGLPTITFGKRLRLHLGDATLELVHTGGHTKATIYAYLVEDKILFTGDNVTANRHPFKLEASFTDWIAALETMQGLHVDVVVPGHGQVCDKAEAARTLDYFRRQRECVSRLVAEGRSEEEVVAQCGDLVNYYPIDAGMEEQAKASFNQGVKRLYRELQGG